MSAENHPLVRAAEALEAEAELKRNRKYRWAYLHAAAHYREEAKRLPEMQTTTLEDYR